MSIAYNNTYKLLYILFIDRQIKALQSFGPGTQKKPFNYRLCLKLIVKLLYFQYLKNDNFYLFIF